MRLERERVPEEDQQIDLTFGDLCPDLLISADTGGPSSRKGSLAGSLASGSPVVAIDGRRTWTELVDARAISLAAPAADALAAALSELLANGRLREELGARGQAFASSRMGTDVSARAVRRLCDEVMAVPPGARRQRLHASRRHLQR